MPDAGTFWYHPHVAESVQMERGLYGAIVVRGDREPRADVEGVLVLDDLLLGADGRSRRRGPRPSSATDARVRCPWSTPLATR
nr:multicopper oxidase domain-containing protein [Deltaproteobacteria bacterium]